MARAKTACEGRREPRKSMLHIITKLWDNEKRL
jgi:hypothetical protein